MNMAHATTPGISYAKKQPRSTFTSTFHCRAYSNEEIVEQFWQGVTPRTKVIYMSQITSPTALRLPVKEICQRASQAGNFDNH